MAPRPIREILDDYWEAHDGPQGLDKVPKVSVAALIEWADGNVERIAAALEAELRRPRPRRNVLDWARPKIVADLGQTSKGRPSKLTPALQAAFVASLLDGNFVETAAGVCGIGVSTVYDWIDRGRQYAADLAAGMPADPDRARYLGFAEAVETARAQAEAEIVSGLRTSALGKVVRSITTDEQGRETISYHAPNVAAQIFYLERTAPDRWGRQRTEITGPDGGPIPLDVQVSARETLADAIARVSERAGLEASDDQVA